jgi:hypothetical protein
VCEGGQFQLERTLESYNRGGEQQKGLFWNFTGDNHQMYLCLPPTDVCEFVLQSELNKTWLFNESDGIGVVIRRERQAFNYVSLCKKHHSGPLCSICEEEGYIKVNGRCEYCGTAEASTAKVFFVLGVIAGACVFFKVILGWKGKAAKTLSHMLQASFMDYLQMASSK